MIDLQVTQNPEMAKFRDVMLEFFHRYLSWESAKDDYIQLYAAEFSESELNEMIAFYQTPTGRKLTEKQPVMMKKGNELGIKRVLEHMPDLFKMIGERVRDQQAQ